MHERYLAVIDADCDGLLAAARNHLGEAVVTCPGWRMRDLVAHVGECYAHKIEPLRDPSMEPPQTWEQPPGDDAPADAVLDWCAQRRQELLDLLGGMDPGTPVWTWHPADQTAAFWARRMAHETVVHRADADLTIGRPLSIDPMVAVDGVDEFLTCFLPSPLAPPPAGRGTLSVATGGRSWLVVLRDGGVDVRADHGDGEAVLTGEPADVLLELWGRPPVRPVSITGDPAVYAAVRAFIAASEEE